MSIRTAATALMPPLFEKFLSARHVNEFAIVRVDRDGEVDRCLVATVNVGDRKRAP